MRYKADQRFAKQCRQGTVAVVVRIGCILHFNFLNRKLFGNSLQKFLAQAC